VAEKAPDKLPDSVSLAIGRPRDTLLRTAANDFNATSIIFHFAKSPTLMRDVWLDSERSQNLAEFSSVRLWTNRQD
jgi:hypothetical protein